MTPWTVAHQAPLSMGFSRQEYWSGLPCPPPGGLLNPGMEPRSPTLQVDSSPSEPRGKPKNTGVGSLSLLQGILPTQEPNQGLLHCRQICILCSKYTNTHRPTNPSPNDKINIHILVRALQRNRTPVRGVYVHVCVCVCVCVCVSACVFITRNCLHKNWCGG